MKLSKATYSGPDSDGELSFEIEALIENSTESIVELVKTSLILVNSEGVSVAGSNDDEEDVFIDSNDTASVDIRSGWVKSCGFSDGLENMKAIVDVQLYRREFHNLGDFPLPKDHKTATHVKKGVDIAGLIKIIGATCIRDKADDDGDIQVGMNIGIRNISDVYFERVTAKFSIFDQEGAEIDRSEDYNCLAPHTGHTLEPSMHGLKAGRLRNCTGKLTINVYQPVGFHSETVVVTKGDSD
jgi:hypothetical protein|tara:strand:+ start:1030 stop:1752 length:723 start_codon:yes stop_codon:yes gene_type:complete